MNHWKEYQEYYKDYFSEADYDSILGNYQYGFISTYVSVKMSQSIIEKMGFEEFLSFSDEQGDFDPSQAVATLLGNEYVDSDGNPSEKYQDFIETAKNFLSQQFDELLTKDERVFYEDFLKEDYEGNIKEAWLKALQVYNEEGDYLAMMIKPYEIPVDEEVTIKPFVVMIIDSNGGELQVLDKFVGFDSFSKRY